MVLEITRSENERVETALAFKSGAMMFPGGVYIPAGSRAIRVGDVLTMDKSELDSTMMKPMKRAVLSSALADTDTSAVLDDAHPFEVGDEIKVGTANAQTCVAINYDTNTVTVDTTWGYLGSVGSEVFCDTDDQDVAVAIANLPVVDKNAYRANARANLITPMESGVFFADAYVTGTFYATKLNGGRMFTVGSNTGSVNLIAGYADVFGSGGLDGFYIRANGLVVVGSPSGNLGYQANA